MTARQAPLPCGGCGAPKPSGRGRHLCDACGLTSFSSTGDRLRTSHHAAEMRRRYGITVEQYQAALIAQNGACAICYQPCRTGQRLCVDHNHETGEVRGLLCRRCNAGLGYLEDVAFMAAAVSFLTAPPGIPQVDRVCGSVLAEAIAS